MTNSVYTARRRRALLVSAVVLAAAAATIPVARAATGEDSGDPAVVRTDAGAVRGTVAADKRSFLGIPYAAPPVGELRWQPPRAAQPWTGTRDATEAGSSCPQAGGLTPGSTDENCLFLNVTTPPAERSTDLPVLVWIHGGAFINGDGASFEADKLLADRDVILVTVNYRLGALGFLAHPALDAGSGAFGIADQQAALTWVQRNAPAFGGDPGNVTLFGESAGGGSVCANLAAPGSAGTFARAIIQSSPCDWSQAAIDPLVVPLADAEAAGTDFAAALGCADEAAAAECLRAVPPEDLLAETAKNASLVPFPPAFGGDVLPEDPGVAIAAGRFAKVPVLQGTNRDEHRLFVALEELGSGRPLSAADYTARLEATFGAQAASVAQRYPVEDFESPSVALATVLTDSSWSCPTLTTVRSLERSVPTFSYEFADVHAPIALPASFPLGAAHAVEVQYLLTGPGPSPGALDAEQQELSEQMVEYWLDFAATGEPNGDGSPEWAPFTDGGNVLRLQPGDGGIAPVDFNDGHHCGFWSEVNQ